MASPQILWDASGLVKRYYQEAGQAAVNAIFQAVPLRDMAITPWGYAETYSILLRKRNGGSLDQSAFRDAITELQMEVIDVAGFTVLSIGDALVFGSVSLMAAHNINSADAAILATYLRFQRASQERCMLIASDRRLVRAVEAEGLRALNPEEVSAGGIPNALASVQG